jgi:hypothetical protein
MKNIKKIFTLIALITVSGLLAHTPPGYDKVKENTIAQTRNDCAQGTSRYDMEINNVRATLLSSGDVWWDLQKGLYIVPKVDPASNVPAVSALYAGGVWVGGKDPSGNLKLCASTYRTGTKTDFWPGPLDDLGNTDATTCDLWDKHFIVKGRDIDRHIKNFREAKAQGNNSVDPSQIPLGVKGWPGVGNPYFTEIHKFQLPAAKKGLALFNDINNDGIYTPAEGDYPVIDVRGCKLEFYPDEMIFWIYNDAGNIHTQSTGSQKIQMEIQVQAFAYTSNDELNDMTFQRYKLINKAPDPIEQTYFAMWVDPDLGCSTDDYIGCDTSRSLMYVYNEDQLDGTSGCVCSGAGGAVPTYCSKIPIIGVDYFRGPRKPIYDVNGKLLKSLVDPAVDSSIELGMSAFTYYNNPGVGNPLPGTTDPLTDKEYYNYLTGKWRDGTAFTQGGSGYNSGSTNNIPYAFPDAPNNKAGWSMCTAGLPFGDRRTIQASGPFRLLPGAVNELIIGVPFVADQAYPCPDIRRMQEADDIAQTLFNNCFKIFNGPDAPDVDIIELDKQLVLTLTNSPDQIISNNSFEQYKEAGIKIPQTQSDIYYKFQGYKIYQISDGNPVGGQDLDNPTKARLIFQVDIKDSISTIYNWNSLTDPNFPGRDVYTPVKKVEGANLGISNTFSIKEDAFASGDKTIINHKKYYFLAVAYAYNNYLNFDEKKSLGQTNAYVEGRRNRGSDGGGKPYIGIPKPINFLTVNSQYGDSPKITRTDGAGNGGNFVDIDAETLTRILNSKNSSVSEISYELGKAPISVKIINPLEVVDGDYDLTMIDNNMANDTLDLGARWKLVDKVNKVTLGNSTIDKLNEQILVNYGFSISIGQVAETGSIPKLLKSNGALGTQITYLNSGKNWFNGIDYTGIKIPVPNRPGVFIEISNKYIKTDLNEINYQKDPNQSLTTMSPFFKPYSLLEYGPEITPAWVNSNNNIAQENTIGRLNNVDIVFTKDKSKWSRCIVVETAHPGYYNGSISGGLGRPTQSKTAFTASNFDVRQMPSVGKEDVNGDGLPDPDNNKELPLLPNGNSNPKKDSALTGYGWFPGYAIDVVTGERLNIFFGENSTFDTSGIYTDSSYINKDMAWNPSSQIFFQPKKPRNPFNNYDLLYLGGQQFIYVTNTKYDSCNALRARLDPRITSQNSTKKVNALKSITWTCMPYLNEGTKMLSYKDGIIPVDLKIKLRVDKPYKVEDYLTRTGNGAKNYYPTYNFKIAGKQSATLTKDKIESELDLVQVVPNPYYGFSDYETNQFVNTIYITNLPAKANVTIYTIDGKFIKEFKKDESLTNLGQTSGDITTYNRGARNGNYTSELAWDLKNSKGIPISSGVYLIYVNAPGKGERVIKWFGINRQFDPSGL